MTSRKLAELLKLPVGERADLAMALTPEQVAELDRRLADHLANPGSGIPWESVCRKFAVGVSP